MFYKFRAFWQKNKNVQLDTISIEIFPKHVFKLVVNRTVHYRYNNHPKFPLFPFFSSFSAAFCAARTQPYLVLKVQYRSPCWLEVALRSLRQSSAWVIATRVITSYGVPPSPATKVPGQNANKRLRNQTSPNINTGINLAASINGVQIAFSRAASQRQRWRWRGRGLRFKGDLWPWPGRPVQRRRRVRAFGWWCWILWKRYGNCCAAYLSAPPFRLTTG